MTQQNKLLDLLLTSHPDELESQLPFIYPSDILDLFNDENVSDDQIKGILDRLPTDFLAQLLDEEHEEDKYELLLQVNQTKHSDILNEMASDELADMLEGLEDDEAQALIDVMSVESQEEVKQLLSYSPESAGGIMATEFINLYDNKTVIKVLEYLREIKDEVESNYALYVTDRNNTLKGVVNLSEIVTHPLDTPISTFMNPNVIVVHVDDDQEDVAKVFDKYNLPVIPVVDDDFHILGIVTFDDIIEIIQQEATEDIHQMAGIHASESADSTVKETIRSRLPWLVVNLFAAILASYIVSSFSDTIESVVALAALMPIVTGMGGNVGSQTYTFTIRSLAIGELDYRNAKDVLSRELQAALFNAVVISVFTVFIAMVIGRDVELGLIVGAAMLIVICFSAFSGFIVPIVLDKFKVDPAIATSVFVTTFTDSFGFLVLLGLASIFLRYLL